MSKDSVKMSPSEISQKWGSRMKGAIPFIQAGVQRVTDSPAAKAIARKDKMLKNVTEAINNGSWENGLKRVSLQEWKDKTINKVGQRMGSGVDEAMPKREKFDTWLVGTLNKVLPEISRMADLTLEDSIARATKFMREMNKNKFKRQ